MTSRQGSARGLRHFLGDPPGQVTDDVGERLAEEFLAILMTRRQGHVEVRGRLESATHLQAGSTASDDSDPWPRARPARRRSTKTPPPAFPVTAPLSPTKRRGWR
jgi:hypothetical protein